MVTLLLFSRLLALVAVSIIPLLQASPSPWCSEGVLSEGVCCAASCGRSCGGFLCNKADGGRNNCCTKQIRRSGTVCTGSRDVACPLPTDGSVPTGELDSPEAKPMPTATPLDDISKPEEEATSKASEPSQRAAKEQAKGGAVLTVKEQLTKRIAENVLTKEFFGSQEQKK